MSDLGITGKRVRKKPKYLRDDEEEDSVEATVEKPVKNKKAKREKEKKSKSKKTSKKSKTTVQDEDSEVSKPGIKLKIKFGGKSSTSSHTSTPTLRDADESYQGSYPGDDSDDVDIEGDTTVSYPHHTAPASPADITDQDSLHAVGSSIISDDEFEPDRPSTSVLPMNKTSGKGTGKDDDDTSDEEREWLQAVESGDIETYEKQKAERNPQQLTARQKRMLRGEEEEHLMELPSQIKAQKTLTIEQIDMKKQKAVKRKQQALEKSEKAKKLTVDRLLKKSDGGIARGKSAKLTGNLRPHMRYLMSRDQVVLSLPAGADFPLPPQKISDPPKVVLCAVSGCKNKKRYNCSKTNVPLCSLQCYEKNISKLKTSK